MRRALRLLPSICVLLVLLVLHAAPLHAQTALPPEHRRIDFLTGSWRTTSEFPDGTVRHGTLSYRWVLGGAWMRIEFVGEAPPGAVWEAHGMQRWSAEAGEYEAWIFAGGGAPVRYRGSSPEPGSYRVELTAADGTVTGIDYRRTADGAVRQENWALHDGERRVTLRTTYRRLLRDHETGHPDRDLFTGGALPE